MINPFKVGGKLEFSFDDATGIVRITTPSGRCFYELADKQLDAGSAIAYALRKFADEIGVLATQGKL